MTKDDLQAQVIEYQKLLTTEQITKEEFDELVEDLLDLEKLESKLGVEDAKVQAQKLIELVKSACNLM